MLLCRATGRHLTRTVPRVAYAARLSMHATAPITNDLPGVAVIGAGPAGLMAAEVIASRASAPRFFVFSDDVAWAEGHLRFPGPTRFVRETAGLRPAIDQRLLASCLHFVIANSTFSWWAAWLGLAPDKMVVVPRKWFAGAEPPTGMIPATWMTSGSPGR